MTLRLRPLLLAGFLCACASLHPRAAAAQVDTAAVAADTLYTIRLTDGSVIYGRILADEGAALTVQTQAGVTLRLERAQIESITRMQGRLVEGRVWPRDPNRTRLFFGPTARSVGAGEGYLGVYEVFFPFLTFGVTDKFSVSGGTPIIPEIIGEYWYFAPKLTFYETDEMAVAAGVLAITADDETAGILYAAGTYGNPDAAGTVGIGYSFSDGDLHERAIFMLGGELRTGAGTKLITENYVIPGADGGDGTLISGGIRFFGERLSADLGIATSPTDCEGACFFPLVNFVYSF